MVSNIVKWASGENEPSGTHLEGICLLDGCPHCGKIGAVWTVSEVGALATLAVTTGICET